MQLNTTTDQNLQELIELMQIDSVDLISQKLQGRPYLANCLGEGVDGQFDQQPLYRLDGFDCVTYVNTVIALARAHNMAAFKKNIVNINYREAVVNYENRHHFISVDWNVYNQQAGFVNDITEQTLPSCVAYAECNIDKPTWYQAKTMADVKLQKHTTDQERACVLASLQAVSRRVMVERSYLPYISIEQLFMGGNSQAFYRAMPTLSIIEIVRPAWDLRATIGTHLNVSHMGFAIKTQQGIKFRHASEIAGKVVTCDLLGYLAAYQQHVTIKGIHVLAYLG